MAARRCCGPNVKAQKERITQGCRVAIAEAASPRPCFRTLKTEGQDSGDTSRFTRVRQRPVGVPRTRGKPAPGILFERRASARTRAAEIDARCRRDVGAPDNPPEPWYHNAWVADSGAEWPSWTPASIALKRHPSAPKARRDMRLRLDLNPG